MGSRDEILLHLVAVVMKYTTLSCHGDEILSCHGDEILLHLVGVHDIVLWVCITMSMYGSAPIYRVSYLCQTMILNILAARKM